LLSWRLRLPCWRLLSCPNACLFLCWRQLLLCWLLLVTLLAPAVTVLASAVKQSPAVAFLKPALLCWHLLGFLSVLAYSRYTLFWRVFSSLFCLACRVFHHLWRGGVGFLLVPYFTDRKDWLQSSGVKPDYYYYLLIGRKLAHGPVFFPYSLFRRLPIFCIIRTYF
jgi:hypothetical protein